MRFLVGEADIMRLEALPASGFDARALAVEPQRNQAFFVAPDDTETVVALHRCYRIEELRQSPYAATNDRVLSLYFSPSGERLPECSKP